MSRVAITGNAAGTGTVTLAAPNTNTDRTLTMPDTSGTLATTDQVGGMRNRIMNGKMEVVQRGTSFVGVQNAYTVDRWTDSNSSSSVVTYSQQADAPAEFQYSLRVTVTTADAAVAAGDFRGIQQPIEGNNVRDLVGKTFTVGFWVRSSKTGIHCLAFRNSTAADRSYIAEYTVNSPNTWEYKTVTVKGGLPPDGTWNYNTGLGLLVSFVMMCGTTYQTAANAWNAGNFTATSNQVNVMDTVGNIFAITGVQLEVGTTATAFEHRHSGFEMMLCQRYYQTSYFDFVTYQSAGSGIRQWVNFPVQLRGTPAMAATSIVYINASAQGFIGINASGFSAGATTTALGASGVQFTYTATAEL